MTPTVTLLLALSALQIAPNMPHSSSMHRMNTRCATPLLLAKKKGGKKKGGGGQKKSGMAWAQDFEIKPTDSAALRELAELLVSSYRTRTGKTLDRSLDRATDTPKALWAAPLCVMVVRTSAKGNSIVEYANPAACEAHGLEAKDGYKQLMDKPTGLASGLSEGKYESGYSKKIVQVGGPADGEPSSVTLRDVERWQLEKMAVVDGKLATEAIGLAYAWEAWEEADGTTCKPGGERIAPSMDPADVQAAVDAQGAKIRQLKDPEGGGLTNKDPEVMEAVAELQRLKALLPAEE